MGNLVEYEGARVGALRSLARDKAREGWVEGTDVSEAQALGVLIAGHFRWDGQPIVELAIAALEDANYHTLASEIEECWQRDLER